MEPPNNIINAADMFAGANVLPRPVQPLSREHLYVLGVTMVESDHEKLLTIPMAAQRVLVESVKTHGFGAAKAMDVMLRQILTLFGFSGTVQFHADEKTFAWSALQTDKMRGVTPPKSEGAAEPAPAPAPKETSSVPNEEEKVAHKSGATSSHFSPFSFYSPFEGAKLTCQRFLEGNRKHENGTTVYADMNWLKALASRDIAFFRDRAGHALEHLLAEMHGNDDDAPGGNLGAVGWWVEVFAYVKSHDPFLYACIQGKHHINDSEAEKAYSVG